MASRHLSSFEEESFISMRELDPSPVEETPPNFEKDNYFPPEVSVSPPPHFRQSTFLGLSGHNITWWLLRTQRYSSYAFTAFLTAHITNTSLIPLATRSLRTSDTYLLLTRPYYQSTLLEPLVVALPLALHISSGLLLRLYRRRQTALRYGAESRAERRNLAWPKLSGISALGYVLAPLALGHAFVNRVLPLWVEGGSSGVGLQYVSHGFAKDPVLANVGYAVFVGVGSWHFAWGWAKWLGWTPDAVDEWWAGEQRDRWRRHRWYAINGVAALVAAAWLSGGLGVVGRGGSLSGWVGRSYDELYRRIPILGRWY